MDQACTTDTASEEALGQPEGPWGGRVRLKETRLAFPPGEACQGCTLAGCGGTAHHAEVAAPGSSAGSSAAPAVPVMDGGDSHTPSVLEPSLWLC